MNLAEMTWPKQRRERESNGPGQQQQPKGSSVFRRSRNSGWQRHWQSREWHWKKKKRGHRKSVGGSVS